MNWRCAAVNLALAAAVVTFKTADGVLLEADYAAAKKDRPTAILVHGVAAGRGEYAAFAASLQNMGWGTLAVDLRWRGERSYGPGVDWPSAVKDIAAAARFLKKRGVKEKQLALIGASIGANLCSQAVAELPKARAVVLLSPGADYHGVRLSRLPPRALAASSPDDAYAHATVARLKGLLPGLTVLEAKSGHGAQMFSDPAFTKELLAWLAR